MIDSPVTGWITGAQKWESGVGDATLWVPCFGFAEKLYASWMLCAMAALGSNVQCVDCASSAIALLE